MTGTFKNLLLAETDQAWKDLGKHIAEDWIMWEARPSLGPLRIMFLFTAIQENNVEEIQRYDKMYQDRCDWFEKEYGLENLHKCLPAYDTPEYRQHLADTWQTPTLSNLLLLADSRYKEIKNV